MVSWVILTIDFLHIIKLFSSGQGIPEGTF